MAFDWETKKQTTITSEGIYKLFQPFCNVKKNSQENNTKVSVSKKMFLLKCQYHDGEETSFPTLFGADGVRRNTLRRCSFFNQYDCCCDDDVACDHANTGEHAEDCGNAGIVLNQKSYMCMICVHRIRKWLRRKKLLFFVLLANRAGDEPSVRSEYRRFHYIDGEGATDIQNMITEFKNIRFTAQDEHCMYAHNYRLHAQAQPSENDVCMVELEQRFFYWNGDEWCEVTETIQQKWLGYVNGTAVKHLLENIENFIFKDNGVTLNTTTGTPRWEIGPFETKIVEEYEDFMRVLKSKKKHQNDKNKSATTELLSWLKQSKQAESNLWNTDSIFVHGVGTYCLFLDLCPATKNGVSSNNHVSLKEACEDLYPIVSNVSNNDGVDFQHVKLLLLLAKHGLETLRAGENEHMDQETFEKFVLEKLSSRNRYHRDDRHLVGR